MSNFNEFIHPRNPFRVKPDFEKLAQKYHELIPHLRKYPNGKCSLDFGDSNALRTLTSVLLKDTFDLKVQIPDDRMIPAVPQRLNYLLWVEDALALLIDKHETDPLVGVDIGTGASCIFPLLGCRLRPNWSFLALELDEISRKNAENNVKENDLQNRISVIQSTARSLLEMPLKSLNLNRIHFVLCNPPFFSTNAGEFEPEIDELPKTQREGQARARSSANTSAQWECVFEGGELKFVTKLVEESLRLAEQVLLFTVMLGRKASAIRLKGILSRLGAHFTNTELCQGKTIRWAIAWTFTGSKEAISQIPCIRHKKPKRPLTFEVPSTRFLYDFHMQSVKKELMAFLQDLQPINIEVKSDGKRHLHVQIVSNINTWSNQRRRRREQARQQLQVEKSDHEQMECVEVTKKEEIGVEAMEGIESTNNAEDLIEINNTQEIMEENMNCESMSFKRSAEDEIICKRQKTIVSDIQTTSNEETFLLNCLISLNERDKERFTVQLETLESATSSESTNQVLQYLINRFSAPKKV